MLVYHLAATKYASDMTGEGARLHGGRWNHKMIPCIYAAESRALSVLEYTVNVNIDLIPRALSMAIIDIPDDAIVALKQSQLPGDWASSPAPSSAKDYGTNLLKKLDALVYKIPSAVIPDEFNYLINPLHPLASRLKVLSVKDFVYDVRIKQ